MSLRLTCITPPPASRIGVTEDVFIPKVSVGCPAGVRPPNVRNSKGFREQRLAMGTAANLVCIGEAYGRNKLGSLLETGHRRFDNGAQLT